MSVLTTFFATFSALINTAMLLLGAALAIFLFGSILLASLFGLFSAIFS